MDDTQSHCLRARESNAFAVPKRLRVERSSAPAAPLAMAPTSRSEVAACGWKLPSGQCEPVARSCAECLNASPSGGEECELLPLSGMCVVAGFSADSEDAWSAPVIAASNGSIIPMDLPTLLASSYDYCAADDSDCSACLRGANATSSLCFGASGCVCLRACEPDAWNATAALLLPAVLSAEPFNASDCTVDASAAGVDVAVGAADGEQSWRESLTGDNECLWAVDGSSNTGALASCWTPRSCYDCLNTPLASGAECAITPGGLCTTADAYVFSRDYRLNASAHAPHFFPSSNTTYCESDDATCQACRDSSVFAAAFSGEEDASAFCVGADGCVCVSFCESPRYNEAVLDMLCAGGASRDSPAAIGSGYGGNEVTSISEMATKSLRLIALVVALCVAVPAVLIVWCGRRARRAARARALAWRNRPPTNGPLLGLEGWKKFREELIEQEQRALQSTGSGEAPLPVSTAIELQRPTFVVAPTTEETDERSGEAVTATTAATEAEGATAYVPMTESEDGQEERRRGR